MFYRYIVSYEDLYDRIKTVHINTGHGGNVKLRMALRNDYYVPRPTIEIFLSTCQTCNCKMSLNHKLVVKTITSDYFNERGRVDLVDFQSTPDGKYKWILNYQDDNIKFVSLCTMESRRVKEVCIHLLGIFLTFGAPRTLLSDKGREFVYRVNDELKSLWPQCVIVHGRPSHSHSSQGSVECANQDIEHMLRAWMQDNNSKRWSVGLHFIQWQKNCSYHYAIGTSPYNALFGKDPKIELTRRRLPTDFIKIIRFEEEPLAEEEVEENEEILTVNFKCSLCKVMLKKVEKQEEAGPILCKFCMAKENAKIQREKVKKILNIPL